MSRWMDHAEALAAHLRTAIPACAAAVPEDERVDVVVMRQHDLLALVNAAVGKSKGLCLVVAWTGGGNPDPKSKRLRMGGRYSISVWALPVVEGDLKADDLLEQALDEAHGFVTAASPNDATRRLAIGDTTLVPHPTFLIYEAKAEVLRLKDMNDQPDTKQDAAAPAAPKPVPVKKAAAEADTRVAKIKTLVPDVKAKGFTFGKGQTVPGVPLTHAEFLEKRGEVRILEVS